MGGKFEDGHFVGTLHADRRFAGVTIAETTYRPGLVVPAHAHVSALVSVVLEGGMTERRGARAVECRPGSLIYQPPDEPHGHRFHDAGGRCFVVQLGSPWIDRLRSLGLVQPESPLALRGTKANWLASQIYREFRTPDTAAELAIEGFTLALLGELARTKGRAAQGAKPPWLLRAVDLLHARFRENLSTAEVAAAVGIHPVHLSRTFSRLHGCTMGDYVRRLRIEHARAELAAGTQSLSQIAYAAGFADQAHFSRVFKQIVGQSPGAFRRATSAALPSSPDLMPLPISG